MPVANFQVANIQLMQYRVPSITAYNRLEASPRTADFDRSLKAEVRDALWMLTRQWQFGEFQGEDAASAATSKIMGVHTAMDQVHFPGNKMVPYDGTVPLEAMVEGEALKPGLFLAVQMGRYFIRLLKKRSDFTDWFNKLLGLYPLNYQPLPNDYEGLQLLAIAKGNTFDGFAFYSQVLTDMLAADIKTNLAAEIISFKNWYLRTYTQPPAGIGSLWQSSTLDYDFSVTSSSSPAPQTRLMAHHYSEGHLDWYSFDLNSTVNKISGPAGTVPTTTTSPGGKSNLASYIPSPVSFKGMPNPRFWMMEDNRIDFGKIDTTPTGLLHLLVAEFGLTCSNDWFMLPYELPVGTLCELNGIVITDVFGQYILISPAGSAPETQWQKWTMFHHTETNPAVTVKNNRFYLAPALTKSLEGAPVEQVKFLRDEMANMVWAVESIVPSQAGKGISGDEMALVKKEDVAAPAPVTEGAAAIGYLLGTTVPDNWVPFIPVQLGNSNTEVQLQRAKMPGSRGAIGTLLTEKAAPYYINEEVIQRSGAKVTFSFQLASSPSGKRNLWLGRKKQNGSGEGWSNLKFDQLVNLPEQP